MDSKNNHLNLPMAIVIAGILIAGAIFLRGSGKTDSQPDKPVAVQPPPALNAITLRPVDAARDHIRGNPDADIMFVEFSDTECPFCKRFHTVMQQLISEYGKSGKVAWVYRQYPIVQLHSKAPKEAEALECAAELGGNEKFWEYTDRLYTLTNSNDSLDSSNLPRMATDVGLNEKLFMDCLSSGRQQARVKSDFDDGIAAGVQGTPHSVLVLKTPISAKRREAILAHMEQFRDQNGDLPVNFSLDGLRVGLNGALPYQSIKATVDALLK
ncbi:MAG: Periplasmic thiol:disulfide interchange protein DsbA [Parcubacteria group bacterium GW2011_GWA2_49_9]|nr:MAG: Periplasmic thiol:disulfide interchange protein DsbA [Parcubacteria group bacterium GW2011_GWA2_49_9]